MHVDTEISYHSADTPEGQIHYTTAGDGKPLPLLAEQYKTFAPDNLGSGSSEPLP
jgi:pimeloyl-ACP methyl ester carboxylesterase